MKPLAVDLCCGLGGWTEGLLAAGYRVVGYDIEAHAYGDERYPGELRLADILTLDGSQFAGAALIVASPPCQDYSYMAMPWAKAKAKAKAIRADETGAELEKLNRLFNACFRIQREASAAAGRHIPLVVENVRGAQPWVGRAAWNYGSFYLWGDVPALMPMTFRAESSKAPGRVHLSDGAPHTARLSNPAEGIKNPGFRFDGSKRSFQSESVRQHNSASRGARKAAAAKVAKIPFPLSHWIGRAYLPPACICPTECDCQEPDGNPALVSEECPVHNYRPEFTPDCPVHDPEPTR